MRQRTDGWGGQKEVPLLLVLHKRVPRRARVYGGVREEFCSFVGHAPAHGRVAGTVARNRSEAVESTRRPHPAGIKAKLKGELTEEDFDDVKQSIAEEITKIERELSALESEKSMMQELMEQSQKDMVDLVTAWRKANTSGKRELQIALFPDGLVWSHESGFLNSQNADLMQKIQTLVDSLEEDIKIGFPIHDLFEHLT